MYSNNRNPVHHQLHAQNTSDKFNLQYENTRSQILLKIHVSLQMLQMYGDDRNPGIIYQTNNYIQHHIKNCDDGKKYKIAVTFIEIYMRFQT